MKNCTPVLFLFFLYSILSFKCYSQEMYFEKVKVENTIIDTPIQNITKDSLGYIWIGTGNGLFKYDGNKFEIYKHNPASYNNIPDNKIKNLVTDNQKQLWFLTYENKHIKFNYSTNQFTIIKDSSKLTKVRRLLLENSNMLNKNKQIKDKHYFLQNNMLYSFNIKTNDTTIYYPKANQQGSLPDENLTCFYIDDQKIIWIGTEKGNIFKATTNKLPFHLNCAYVQKNSQLIQCQITSLALVNNEIWLGTLNNGIQIKNKNGEYIWNHPFTKTNKKFKDILSLHKDNLGNIWIGTRNEGLWFYNKKKHTIHKIIDQNTPNAYINKPYFYCITSAHDNNILAGAYKGIFKINKETNNFKRADLHIQIDKINIRDIIEDRNHYIWIATDGYTVYRLNIDSNFTLINHYHFKDFSEVTNGKYEGECAYCLLEDSHGYVWTGTSEGLYRINKKDLTVKAYTKNEGLQDQYICSIEEDKDGNIWVSTKKGISEIHHIDESISNYTISDENRNWVFMNSSSYNDTTTNTLYFGAREGYISFNPKLIKSKRYEPEIRFKNLFISGKKIHPNEKINNQVILTKSITQTKEIVLNYKSNSFAIESNSLNYQGSNTEIFYYKLKGYNTEWIRSNSNIATFVKIPPGNYKFQTKTISADNILSDVISIDITITPPWYATNWAYAAYLLLFFGILFIINQIISFQNNLKNKILYEKLNAEKQQEFNKEKIEFFTNISHELRTPLTLITDPLNQLLNKDLEEKQKKIYSTIIQDNVNNLVHLVNQILDFRKMEVIKVEPKLIATNIIKSLENCTQNFNATAHSRNIELTFFSECNTLYGYFDSKIIDQILINIISNSFKYTANNGFIHVKVTTNESKDMLSLKIEDNGIGMDEKKLQNLFENFNKENNKTFWGKSSGIGMALTKKYIDLIDGNIEVKSTKDKGTTVIIDIPFQITSEPELEENSETKNKIEPVIPNDQNLDSKGEKKTILIVEDNIDIQNYLKIELGNSYEVISELNGVDGLKKAVEIIPDVIISDVMMPLMDGIELCKQIKTNEKTNHIPVLLLTAKATEEDQISGLQTGADVFIPKPFSVEVLKAQVYSIIENRTKQQMQLSSKMYISELESEENKEDARFLKKAISIIMDNLEDMNFNTENLARLLNLSERQLYRKLKAISGSTVNEFIKRVKMEEAAKLLTTTNLKIFEISYKVGFSEPSNFSRTFTKHFGFSPTEYAKTH